MYECAFWFLLYVFFCDVREISLSLSLSLSLTLSVSLSFSLSSSLSLSLSLPLSLSLSHFFSIYQLVVLSDEIYERLTYGEPHVSLASLPNMMVSTYTALYLYASIYCIFLFALLDIYVRVFLYIYVCVLLWMYVFVSVYVCSEWVCMCVCFVSRPIYLIFLVHVKSYVCVCLPVCVTCHIFLKSNQICIRLNFFNQKLL